MRWLSRCDHETLWDYTGIGGSTKSCQAAIGTSGQNMVKTVERNNDSSPRDYIALYTNRVFEIHSLKSPWMAAGWPWALVCKMEKSNGSSRVTQNCAPPLADQCKYSLKISIRLDGVLQNCGMPYSARQREQVLRPICQQCYSVLLGAKKNGYQISQTKDNLFGFHSHKSIFWQQKSLRSQWHCCKRA